LKDPTVIGLQLIKEKSFSVGTSTGTGSDNPLQTLRFAQP
jgi:hypothetical protein